MGTMNDNYTNETNEFAQNLFDAHERAIKTAMGLGHTVGWFDLSEVEQRYWFSVAASLEANGWQRYPCDGGCNINDGPDEVCSRHGRRPKEIWDRVESIHKENLKLEQAGVDVIKALHEFISFVDMEYRPPFPAGTSFAGKQLNEAQLKLRALIPSWLF